MGLFGTIKSKIRSFVDSKKEYPIIAAIAAGSFPLLHNYSSNFTLVNSKAQLLFFLAVFIGLPILVFSLVNEVFKRIDFFKPYGKYVLPILGLSTMTILSILSTYGPKKKMIAVAVLIVVVLAIILHKHFKKIIVLQLIMAFIGIYNLIPKLMIPLNYSNQWMVSSDDITSVKFKKKPNIYIVQPDGYTGFSELKGKHYNIDNSEFESYLQTNGFTLYPDFRSNYFSTLSSNSSMFAMNHHYYNNVKGQSHEFYNARKIIIGDNPVVSIFKNNGYKTNLILENSYLLVNRSDIKYDYCNIDYDEVPYMARGFRVKKETEIDLENAIANNDAQHGFYFIEQISPGHIPTFKRDSNGKEEERLSYIQKLGYANDWLKDIIKTITSHDKEAIIVIVADHGGFVGYEYSLESTIKQEDKTLINSAFSSALAIKWPNGNPPGFHDKLKSNVNVFRILYAYLAEDESYLANLQEDKSYIIIKKGAPKGVYEMIDAEGTFVFEKRVD